MTGDRAAFGGFLLALVLLAGAALLEWRHTQRMKETAEWVAHTHRVRANRSLAKSLLLEAEVRQHAYLLSGQPTHLERFEAAAGLLEEKSRSLADLTHDAQQKTNLATLQSLINQRLALARRTVALRRDPATPADALEASRREGEELTARLDAQFARMNNRGDVLLLERSAAADREAGRTRALLIAGNALGVALFVTLFVLMRRESRLRQRAHEALRLSEERLAVTLQSIGDAVLATDAQGRVTRLNAAAETLTGWTDAAAAGRPVAEVFRIINETTRAPAFLPVLDTLATGTRHGLANHTVLIARDGSERPIADSCAPIRDRAGRVIGAVLAFRDVTREQAADLALRRSQRELEAVVQSNRLILENSLDVICTIDAEGRFVFVSAASEQVWGYPPAELAGRRYLDLVAPEDRDRTVAAAAELAQGRPLRNFENRYQRKDGTTVPIVWSATWSAEQQMSICIARDITERKRREEALRQAHADLGRVNAELAQAARLKDEFLANMSHELRTPLNAILGLSEALLEQISAPLTPRQIKSVTTISSSGQHLLALINDILDLSKIEAGRLELHAEAVDVEEFCQGCLAFVRTQATQKHIEVSCEHDGRVPRLTADPRRLKQILVNLLTNAVKFTPEGGRIGLAVAEVSGGEAVRFTVWDSGIGIATADQGRLFTAFTQIDSGLNRAQEGTGLGLALVAKLAALHGGSVTLESEPGRGSRFIVTLPQTPRPWPPPLQPPPAATPDRRDYRRALIVEDDPVSGALLTGYVAELGLTSVLHVRGEEAIPVALRERPDVILLDIQLPNESGWVVLTRFKEHPQTREIPVVVISVVDEPGKSRALGAAAHFTKPVTRAQLAAFFQRTWTTPPPPTPGRVVPPLPTGPTLLFAEDNEANIQTLGGYLEDKGYALHYARNGRLAVQLARELRPALILMDVQMPVLDGLAAIRELRADPDPAVRAIPILALTALAMPGDRERCLAAGASDYLSKPVSLKQLTALVSHFAPPLSRAPTSAPS